MADTGLCYVLLPGLDGTSVLFEPLLEHLRLPARAVDYPQRRPTGYADLLPAVRDACPRDRSFVLLGWSFSGPLALLAAAERPLGLAGVVLCASFVTKPVPYLPAAIRYLASPLLFHWTTTFVRAKALLSGHGTARLDRLLVRAHAQVPAAVMAERVRATLTVDVRRELVACPVPVCYLRARADRVVPAASLRLVRRLRPDVEVREIAGPHLALATNPDAAAHALEAFAATVADRSPAQRPRVAAADGHG